MANHDANAQRKDLPEGVQTERRINGVGPDGVPYGNAVTDILSHMSNEEIRRRSDSMIENIGALRFSLARIEHLEAQKQAFVDMMKDVRICLQAAGYKLLDSKIGALLQATAE